MSVIPQGTRRLTRSYFVTTAVVKHPWIIKKTRLIWRLRSAVLHPALIRGPRVCRVKWNVIFARRRRRLVVLFRLNIHFIYIYIYKRTRTRSVSTRVFSFSSPSLSLSLSLSVSISVETPGVSRKQMEILRGLQSGCDKLQPPVKLKRNHGFDGGAIPRTGSKNANERRISGDIPGKSPPPGGDKSEQFDADTSCRNLFTNSTRCQESWIVAYETFAK